MNFFIIFADSIVLVWCLLTFLQVFICLCINNHNWNSLVLLGLGLEKVETL